MRRMFGIVFLACTFPVASQAQHHAGVAMPVMSGMHFTAAPGQTALPHLAPIRPVVSGRAPGQPVRTGTRLAASPRAITHTGWNHATRRSTTSTDPVFPNGNLTTNGYPVPGLGFDYTHFFATHPNAGHCRHCSGFAVPFVDGGGLYIPYPMYLDQGSAAPTAEGSETAEQSAPLEEPVQDMNYNPPSRVRSQPAAPPAEQAEYVFVRRDGTLIFAVAYSWINDRLQYVTQEGLRRTLPVNTLDLDATQQFNDQRGVPIRLPA